MLLKIVVARLNHETNTFSPITTPLDAFAPQWDEAAYRDQKGARTAMGAFLDIADGLGATIVTPIAAMANPSAAVAADAYTLMNDAILRAISVGCDAIMLDLHGAMVAENAEDGEGSLLQKIREIAPDTPLCVALDLHGNITQKIIDNADIIVSFKTYPHIDMYEDDLLVYGKYTLLDAPNTDVYAYTRETDKQKVLVLLNFKNKIAVFDKGKLQLGNEMINNMQNLKIEGTKVMLQPYQACIVKLN